MKGSTIIVELILIEKSYGIDKMIETNWLYHNTHTANVTMVGPIIRDRSIQAILKPPRTREPCQCSIN